MQGVSSGKYCKVHGIEKTVWNRGSGRGTGWWECYTCKARSVQKGNVRKRREAFTALGGKCARCGETDWCVLQVDHVNGDGAEEKKSFGIGSFSSGLTKVAFRQWFYSHLDRYQLLCANCHVRKGREHDDMQKNRRKWTVPGNCAFMEVDDAT